ncbi:hypothetical protein M433DRAFT_275722 [Acidomyces richmondensis BFW]|nr:MAG: hypothetical protein FE78DRAFT_449731 [Acidomyces sp. 'richmondensis']KYG49636.1 hypothetical protein M433DRAFT_275722 [Acidomyces richmondensis BFW]
MVTVTLVGFLFIYVLRILLFLHHVTQQLQHSTIEISLSPEHPYCVNCICPDISINLHPLDHNPQSHISLP